MIEEVFQSLIGQFSDPFTFLRELVQNAIDAGSNRIDVDVAWDAEERRACVEVVDDGEGMNRRIIDHELTRLFSSSKEGDLTKIGKFGIGFVSVFAIEPQLVAVDTGRDGEFWRVLFDGTTSFECLRLAEPVEGTRVRLFKALESKELDGFIARAGDTLRRWCRFSDTPIFFRGEAVNESLRIDSPCALEHGVPGTEIAVGLVNAAAPAFGMYNRGLTLKEGAEALHPGVSFRIKSRYLEHTLTRDDVMRDANYRKAMKLLEQVIRQRLSRSFFEMAGAADGDALETLMESAQPYLAAWRKALPAACHALPLFPTLHGERLGISGLRHAALLEDAVYVDTAPSQVSEALAERGVPVVAAAGGSAVAAAVLAVTGREPRVASQCVAAPQVLDREVGPLGPVLIELLRQGRMRVRDVRLARFDYPGSAVATRPCLAQAAEDEPVRLFRRAFWHNLRLFPGRLLLNATHPLVTSALARSHTDPTLAGFVLAKAALLQDGVPAELEARLLGRCLP